MSTVVATNSSSYRDPSGFIFEKEGVLYRQVNVVFREDFNSFIETGCYERLVAKGLLISHQTINENLTSRNDWYTTLQPEKIDFISYPAEWSFDMLKDAALLTLQLVKESIPFGLLLKDATPYNIQWHNGKLIFIDTLSFEKYVESQPWIAYRQFCETFLGPLLLMHYHKMPMQELYCAYPEGVPLAVTSTLLPLKSRFSLNTYLHIFLHARISGNIRKPNNARGGFSKQKLLNLVESLESLVKKLKLSPGSSTWSGYYGEASQRSDYLEKKKEIITRWLQQLRGLTTCADAGANEGEFSQLAANLGLKTLAADFDARCINRLYQKIKLSNEKNLQPLVLDVANPSGASGVNNEERKSFLQRANTDIVLALALLHHLVIGRNIPFSIVAGFFNRITRNLIIEFIPKEDEKIQLMLMNKKDIYDQYHVLNFENDFSRFFSIEKKEMIGDSGRVLYFMKRIVHVQIPS